MWIKVLGWGGARERSKERGKGHSTRLLDWLELECHMLGGSYLGLPLVP